MAANNLMEQIVKASEAIIYLFVPKCFIIWGVDKHMFNSDVV